MAMCAKLATLGSTPITDGASMDTSAPIAPLVTMTGTAKLVGLVKGDQGTVGNHQPVDILDGMALVTPKAPISVIELRIAHYVKGRELATRGIGREFAMALAARKSRDQLQPRFDRQRRGRRRLVGSRLTTLDRLATASDTQPASEEPVRLFWAVPTSSQGASFCLGSPTSGWAWSWEARAVGGSILSIPRMGASIEIGQ